MNILISGMSCSGKTYFANKIKNEFDSVNVISQDSYFKDKEELPRDENNYFLFDSPSAFDTDT